MIFSTTRYSATLCSVMLLVSAAAANAASTDAGFPSRPIRLIVPFSPGGGTDLTARLIAQKLTEAWHQQVVVDNRPGANGTIGVTIAAKSSPDGYTLTMISSSHTVNVNLLKTIPYDLMRDLQPVTQATRQPYALVVNPSLPAKSVRELIALAKAKPGTLNFGSSGRGGLSHLAGEMFGELAGIKIVHIPYKGGNPAMIDVIAGRIDMLFSTLLQAGPHVKAGRLRALAVTTAKRWPGTPEIPTMMEAGVPGYEVTQWYGMLMPAKVPQPIVMKSSKEIARILHEPEVRNRLATDGAEAVGNTPAQFGAHIRAEIAKWAKIIKQIGLKKI
jgi:tripartite-type tricarboxylate transporter receptor subunit TctC